MNPLTAHIRTRQKVRVCRTRPSTPIINGYVLAASDELALMHCFDDFEPDGYTVLRTCDIERVRSGEYERHWDRMLEGEGLRGGLRFCPPVDLSSMQAAIQSIHGHYPYMIIEVEDEHEPIQDFYIGYPLIAGPGGTIFRHFDGLGRWYDMPALINTDEITLIQFDTPYINRFTKYLDEHTPGDE